MFNSRLGVFKTKYKKYFFHSETTYGDITYIRSSWDLNPILNRMFKSNSHVMVSYKCKFRF